MRRNKATPEQIAKAKEKRAKVREIAKRISAMSEEQRRAVVRDWPTTIEGHALSVHNACLLAYQTLGAQPLSVVGGFRQWKKAGRYVKKGESGFSIWIPLMRGRKTDKETGEITDEGERTGFGLATVFDISQTEDANAAIAQDERETGLPTRPSNEGKRIDDGRYFYGLTFHDPNYDPGKAVIGKDCSDRTLSKTGSEGETVEEAEKAGKSFGLERIQAAYSASSKHATERHTVPSIDGGCGFSSVEQIAKAIGLGLQYVPVRSKTLDVYQLIDNRNGGNA